MDDLFDIIEEKKQADQPKQQESAENSGELPESNEPLEKKPQQSDKSEKRGNLKRTLLTGAMLFFVPFCIAILLAFIAKKISPTHIATREALVEEQVKETNGPAIPPSGAGISELVEYRSVLRERGESIAFANLRIWAAAGNEPTTLFEILPPDIGEWKWTLSQCGEYALAIENPSPETLIKNVALYSFKEESWIWKNRIPWPENYEAPWIFGGNLVLRSSKNGRRFAMELDEDGNIIALDSLPDGKPFTTEKITCPEDIPGECIAKHSRTLFVSDDNSTLKAYAQDRLPGLYTAGISQENSLISGNGLLMASAGNGLIEIRDSFTSQPLETKEAWNHSTNTVIRGIESNRDGSEIAVHLTSSYNFDEPVERNWSLTYKPSDDIIETNMTNPPAFTPAAITNNIQIPERGLSISLEGMVMTISTAENPQAQSIKVDFADHMMSQDTSISEFSLLEDKRYLFIRGVSSAYLLDIYAVVHYGDLLDRIEQSNRILAKYSNEELSRTNKLNDALREVQGEDRDPLSDDNFNYLMEDYEIYFMDPRELAPPAKPSILSLQAEFLATHHAWLYAAQKLERLLDIQEQDHRAPKANPLLYARYSLLSGNRKDAKKGCVKGLEPLFYKESSYNRMIRWQLFEMLFQEAE